MDAKQFFKNFGVGALIGVAMIIPGVSGGTVAVLLNVYDKLINAISGLRKDFKNSFFFLLPVLLGALVGVAALIFPIRWAFDKAPLPTILLFTGLMLGSVPKLIKDGASKGFAKRNILSVLIPIAVLVGICFIPHLGDVDLSVNMPVYGYFLLILMGALSSCALVVPGISGSLTLLIFGYYAPIVATVSSLFTSFGHSLLVLALFALGLIIGFFTIAKLMKLLLEKLPRGTYWAIIGFVLGSFPAIFLTFDFSHPSITVIHIVAGCIFCSAGAIATYTLTAMAENSRKQKQSAAPRD